MQTTGSAEMPLLTELIETVKAIGPAATSMAMSNARNKSITILEDPVAQLVIEAVTQEIGISLDNLREKSGRTTKKRHGLIIISHCLLKLKYKQEDVGTIITRSRKQVNRYNLIMQNATLGSLAKYKLQFEPLIKSLIKKTVKKKTNAKRKK